MKIPEYYPKKQARPEAPIIVDLESGQSLSTQNSNTLLEEYMLVKETLDKLLNEVIQQQEKLLIEAQQMKLHLASLSGENISEEDVDG